MLIHGTLDSSDAFLMNEESIAPAFFLANNGYDVWLGNDRGNYYSYEHVSLSCKSKEFWDFSLDQMASQDLPSAFEYISSVTQQEKINYIGHSQGTQIMFAALSLNNQVVKKHLRAFIGLAPAVFSLNSNTTTNKISSFLLKKFQDAAYLLRIYEFLPRYETITEVGPLACKIAPQICEKLLAGEEFAFFDYGSADENAQHYGSAQPPVYNLSNVDQNIFLFIGSYDKLVLTPDWQHLISLLNNVPKLYWKVYPAGHCTWIWGYKEHVEAYLNDVLQILKDPENPQIKFNIGQNLNQPY